MGKSLRAVCDCGYEGCAVIGSTRHDHGLVFMYPHRCGSCGELVNVDLLGQSAACLFCAGDNITRYGSRTSSESKTAGQGWLQRLLAPHPRMCAEKPVETTDAEADVTYCHSLQSEFHLPATGNTCPKCGQSCLTFDPPDITTD